MAKTFSIPLMEVDAGNGNALIMSTGKTVTLRENPYTTTLYTLAETATPGVYAGEVEDKIVRLYVNGVYKESYGTFRTYGDLATILAAYLKQDIDGNWDGQSKRLHSISDPVSGIDVGDRDFNDARYLLLSNYVSTLPAKTLIVSDQLTAVTGKIYNTPQAAIDYANSQLPNEPNFWKIYIYPNANSRTGYSGNVVMQSNIKLIGVGLAKISGALSGLSQYTHFQNIMFQHSGNLTLSGSATFRDCVARLTGSSVATITIDTIKAVGLGLLKTHANHTIVSNGNNNITGFTNLEFEKQSTDKVYLDFLPGIDDFDLCASAE